MSITIEGPVITDEERVRVNSGLDETLKKSQQSNSTGKAKLIGPNGEVIELSEALFIFSVKLLSNLLNKRSISIVPGSKYLGTQEAADLLNVSRPFLVVLLKKGEIPFIKVGSHGRVSFEDLISYKEQRDITRRQALDKVTELSQEGNYY